MLSGTLRFTLGRTCLGRGMAYIYILCSKRNHVVYVGQTNARGGVLTRLGGHLDHNGTFRKRLSESLLVDVEELDDLEVFAFALPPLPQYTSLDETYREGVEYGVQKRLQTLRAQWQPYFQIVSNVTAPDTTGLPEVIRLSQQIVTELERLYHTPA